MRKFIFPALLFFCSPFISFAQTPTITAANVAPVPGDEFVIHNCYTYGVDAGPSGADTSWDFSMLATLTAHGSVDTGSAVPSSSVPTHAMFPESTLAIMTQSSPLTAYYISSPTKLSQNGIYMSATNYTSYTDPMDQLQFPFTFNNTFTDHYLSQVVYTPAGGGATVHAINEGSITVAADAYGTLTLPADPNSPAAVYANTLRLHGLQFYTDSINLSGSPTVETDTAETYTWYAPGYHNALLTIATITGPGINSKQVFYSSKQLAGPEGITAQTAMNAFLNLYPNPASNVLNIAYNTTNNGRVRISLSDMLGREVAVIADHNSNAQGAQSLCYNTSTLPKGLYLLHLQTSSETTTRKVIIQ